MMKTPVSILQEYVVQKRLTVPDYDFTGSGEAHQMAFSCTVKVGNHTAVGNALTKKDAKQKAASNLLETFGVKLCKTEEMSNICLMPTKAKKEFPTINYVGKLNEFASGHKHPQPEYDLDTALVHNTQFCVLCVFLEFQSEGYGTSKKDAKQDAARKMLALIKDNSLLYTAIEQSQVDCTSRLEENNENVEKVLQKYSEIMKNVHITNNAPENNNNEVASSNEQLISIRTWEDLVKYMDNLGWSHEITVFQSLPLILSLKINDQTLMNSGKNREEILQKFVGTVVRMLEGVLIVNCLPCLYIYSRQSLETR